MKKTWIALSLCALAFTFTGCSGNKADSTANEATTPAASQPVPTAPTTGQNSSDLSKEGHNTLLMFYSFYALQSDEGFNQWLTATFTKPDQYKDSFKKLFKPGTYTNVAVEFSGFEAKPGDQNEATITSNIKLHLINKTQNKEDIIDKKITAKIVKDDKDQTYKIVSFEETAK